MPAAMKAQVNPIAAAAVLPKNVPSAYPTDYRRIKKPET